MGSGYRIQTRPVKSPTRVHNPLQVNYRKPPGIFQYLHLIIIIYVFNPICSDLVFGRYLEHPDSDLGDSGSVAIVGTRATVLWPVSECFSFINYILSCFVQWIDKS